MGQPIRPSQMILSYGVGSIIETQKGPRLFPKFEKWDFNLTIFSSLALKVSLINEPNAKAQLGGGEIFEIPTNAQLDLPVSESLFKTIRFPHWALCQRHKILYRLGPQGRSHCPECKARIKDAQDEAIRFIRACPNGHIDDVDWKSSVHGGGSCQGDTFDWVIDTGSDLKSVRVRCRTCHVEVSLLDIYYRTSACSGFLPEEGEYEACNEKASVLLRSATSLRIAEVVTSLTIPPPALQIHNILSQPAIGRGLLTLAASSQDPKTGLLANLRVIVSNNPNEIDPTTITELERYSSDEVTQAINDLLATPDRDKSIIEVKEEEFRALEDAAEHGYPPKPSMKPLFEVDLHSVLKRLSHASGITFRITPVKRLRVILAQRGYRRPVRGITYDDGRPIRLIETYFTRNGKKYYPGVELFGEGIFIDLPYGNPTLERERSELWFQRKRHAGNVSEAYVFDPLFVWWHSLSHRLIKGLSLDSGYSSAAIRERVYFNERSGKQEPTGGVLLYASQQGSDGTLGGLIALCGENEFRRVLKAAERDLNACSNDPLCSEHFGRDNGAACYVCLLMSETSCEFHNVYLDRLLLSQSLLGSPK